MRIATVGIDLAKRVFQVHGVDGHGNTMLRKQLKRERLSVFMATLPPCRVWDGRVWRRALLGAQV